MNITLKRGDNTAVVTANGGELISFRDKAGREYIWTGDAAYWPGRNPVLFPIVGNLKDGRVEIKGAQYQMGRHGFARRSRFSVTEQGEDFAVLELRESPETLAQYPYPFRLRITHRVLEGGFSTAFEVSNPGSETLPFCIGAHTGINCPLNPGEKFEDYELYFDEEEDAQAIGITAEGLISPSIRRRLLDHTHSIALSYKLIEDCATLIFEGQRADKGLRSTGVSLRHRDTGRGARMDFPGWPLIAFWTAKEGAPFLCLEPWSGCAAVENESGRFEDKPCCTRLAPGERARFQYSVTIL